MKTLKIILVIGVAPLLQHSLPAQTQGELVVTEQQKLITEEKDQVTARQLKVRELNAPGGPVAQANTTTQSVADNIKANNLEPAAKSYWQGVEAGIPGFYRDGAAREEQFARDAMQGAVRVARQAMQRAKATAPMGDPSSLLNGDASEEARKDMEGVQKMEKELGRDVVDYIRQLGLSLPEMNHILAQEGMTPASTREMVINLFKEALQHQHAAQVNRINADLWDNFGKIIRSRYANGGQPQEMVHQSAEEYLKAAQNNKIKL